ncbi:MAG: UDP-3-O-acyl-N-acetylglucosamine deacetylase [Elainellaceae cyanobacterium]
METAARQTDNAPHRLHQGTLAAPVERVGIGLHSGIESRVRISPAAPDSGRTFVCNMRSDQDNAGGSDSRVVIPATIDHVIGTQLSTELGIDGVSVRTVEHLLAALVGMGIDNARIDIDGPEVPLLDGSALGWTEAIASAGRELQRDKTPWTIAHPLSLQDGEAWLTAFPSDGCRFTYGIDFDVPAIGNQWFSWDPEQEPFATAIAPARTFGLAHQIDQLRQRGLIRGGSLENALVCSDTGWLNPPLRFPNEPVRHKLLDLVGDISLIGSLPQAHIVAYRASHRLHVEFAQRLMASAIQPSTLSNILS